MKSTKPTGVTSQSEGRKSGSGKTHTDSGINTRRQQSADPRGERVYGDSPKVRSMGTGKMPGHSVSKSPIKRGAPSKIC